MNRHATKRKSAKENYIFKFLTVSSVSSYSRVKGIIDDIVNTAVKTAEVSNYGEFLKDKNVLLCTRLQVRSEFGKFAYTAICMRNVYTQI
jgi:L-rhamnose mutarotase